MEKSKSTFSLNNGFRSRMESVQEVLTYFRGYGFEWDYNMLLLYFSFMSKINFIAASPWGHRPLSADLWKCSLYPKKYFCVERHFIFPAMHREKEGEKLGQQPSACCCHTDSLCLNDSAPQPPVCWCLWFLHSLSASPNPPGTLCLPFSLSLFWSCFICLSKQSIWQSRCVQCPTLLCSIFFLILTSANVDLRFRSYTVQAYCDEFTLCFIHSL